MKKYLWIIVIVVLALLYFVFTRNSSPTVDTMSSTPSPSSSAPSTIINKPHTTTTQSAPATSYTDLVKQFGDRRIQFDASCQVSPQMMTYKNGAVVMLDNRSSTPKAISIGSNHYNLGARGYMIVSLNSSSLPKDLAINCNNSFNVGKILLQALISN